MYIIYLVTPWIDDFGQYHINDEPCSGLYSPSESCWMVPGTVDPRED